MKTKVMKLSAAFFSILFATSITIAADETRNIVIPNPFITNSPATARTDETKNEDETLFKILDSNVAAAVISLLAGAAGFFFSKRISQQQDQKKETEKYLVCLKGTTDEIRFYRDKLVFTSQQIDTLAQNLKSGSQHIVAPSYSFYPQFLEKCKGDLSSFFRDAKLVRSVGHCHFELCHIVERLAWLKGVLVGPHTANQKALIANIDGVKGLIDANITTFTSALDDLEREVSKVEQNQKEKS